MTDEEHAQLEYQAQFRRIVIRTVILIACAALLLGVGRVLRDWQPDRRAIPLITGDILYYRGATFGTHHVAPGLPRLVHGLPAVLRDPITRYLRLAPGSGEYTTAEPRLVLWLDDTHPMVTNRMAPVSVEWMLADHRGHLAGTRVGTLLAPGQPGLIRLEFKAFPRRGRLMQLQAFARVSGGPLRAAGDFMVPNLYRSREAEWTPDSLPLTQTHTGLDCTLLALPTEVGSNVRWISESDASVTLSCAVPDSASEMRAAGLFSFHEPGGRAGDWTVGNIRLNDATGNQLVSSSISTSPGHGYVLFSFGPVLWPDETWRLEVRAKRTAGATFTAEEQFEFEEIPVPPERSAGRVGRVIRRGDLAVELREVEHKTPLADRTGYSTGELSRLTVLVSGLREGLYLDLLEVVDDQGRSVSGAGWALSHSDPIEARFFLREIPPGARALNVRLAVQEGRPFVFQVRPELSSTNGWSKRLGSDLKF